MGEGVHAVGEVDGAVVVGVGGIAAARRDVPEEEEPKVRMASLMSTTPLELASPRRNLRSAAEAEPGATLDAMARIATRTRPRFRLTDSMGSHGSSRPRGALPRRTRRRPDGLQAPAQR